MAVDPLQSQEPIIDKETGAPSEYFLRQWSLQQAANEASSLTSNELGDLVAAFGLMSAISIVAGNGLEGGGSLGGGEDIQLDLTNTGVIPTTYGDASNVPQIVVDAQGRITSVEDIAISGGGGGGDTVVDDYWWNVVYLADFDGVDASTSFVDNSPYARTLTAIGNAQLDTDQFKFGVSSALFDGSGDGVSAADAAELEVGSGDFTIEMFVRWNGTPGTLETLACKYNNTGNQRSWFIRIDTGDLDFVYSTTGSALTHYSELWSPAGDTWYHLAFTRNGADLKMFVDGTQLGTTHNIGTSVLYDGTGLMRLGQLYSSGGAQYFTGWLDEFRMTVGVSRYDADFTVPTEAFPQEGPPTVSVQDEGTEIIEHPGAINFKGAGVVATDGGAGVVDVTISGGGGGGGSNIFGGFDHLNNASSTSGYAAKGNVLKPFKDITVAYLHFMLDPASTGYTFNAFVTALDASNVITGIVLSTGQTGLSAGQQLVTFAFSTTMSAGTKYFIGLSRTDGTNTYGTKLMNSGPPANVISYFNFPVTPYAFGTDNPWGRIAKAVPIIGDTVLLGVGPFAVGLEGSY